MVVAVPGVEAHVVEVVVEVAPGTAPDQDPGPPGDTEVPPLTLLSEGPSLDPDLDPGTDTKQWLETLNKQSYF